MTTIIGISGSLRQRSFNTALLRAAAGLMPADATLVVRTLHGIPLYNADDEAAAGAPAAVRELKAAIAAADGVLLATPEYNNSIPGVFKNAIDWLSSDTDESVPPVFTGKPVAIIGASPTRFGTLLSQAAWLPVLRTLEMKPWFGDRLLVPLAAQAFDASGRLVDAALQERLRRFMAGFVKFAAKEL